MARWDDVVEDLLGFAEDDLRRDGEVSPVLLAFSGEDERLVAWLRPFPKGAYHHPIGELLAITVPLGADRYAAMFSGRAWSVDDPIPPVSEDADLRQRVVTVTAVDGARRSRAPLHRNVLVPFDLLDDVGGITWGDRLEDDEPLVGSWVPQALDAAARRPGAFSASDAALREQVARCSLLGHDVYLAPDVLAVIAGEPTPSSLPSSPSWDVVRRAQPRRRARAAGPRRASRGSGCR